MADLAEVIQALPNFVRYVVVGRAYRKRATLSSGSLPDAGGGVCLRVPSSALRNRRRIRDRRLVAFPITHVVIRGVRIDIPW